MTTPTTMNTRCPTCFRTERWHDGVPTVLQEGGARQPAAPRFLATWAVLAAWRRGGPTVVGVCRACGEPMVSDAPNAPAVAQWTLSTPAGDLVIGEDLVGPSGPLTVDAADAFVTAQAPSAARQLVRELPMVPFLVVGGVFALAIFVIWLWAGSFFLAFVVNGAAQNGFSAPPGM